MSATYPSYPDDGFQLVSSPRSGPVYSALFHHLKRNGLRCMQAARADGTLQRIIEPSDRLNAFLLMLNPTVEHDLFQHLPGDIKKAYPQYKLQDRHIRIDQRFGTAGSKLAREKLHYQWHYTERINVGNGDSVAIHVYFHYGINTGVYIKVGDRTLAADNDFAALAYKNCTDAINIVLNAVEDMQREKQRLNETLKEKLAAIGKLDLKSAEHDVVDAVRNAARKAHEALSHYQEDVIDKRYEIAKASILYVRTDPTSNEEEVESSPSLADEPVVTRTDMKVVLPPRRLQLAARKTDNVLTVAQLQERYNELRNLPRTTAAQAQSFEVAVQDLKLEVLATSIHSRDKASITRCDVIAKLLAAFPSLLDVFLIFAYDLNVEAVAMLFPHVQAEIPECFYTNFLAEIAHKQLTAVEESNAAQICELFFAKSQDYRVLMSLLHTVTLSYTTPSGTPIALSLLMQLPLNGNLLLFRTIIGQCGCPNFHGYIENRRIASLLTVLCMFSNNNQSDSAIMSLLDRNPTIEARGIFAAGVGCKQIVPHKDAVESRLFASKPKTKPSSDAEKDVCSDAEMALYQEMLCDTPYFGSALTAYSVANYQSPAVLSRLIKLTSTLHVVFAFAAYRYKGINYSLIFSPSQFGVATESDREEMGEMAKKYAMQCAFQPMRYLGCVYAGDDAIVTEGVQLFCKELQKRLTTTAESDLNQMIGQLLQCEEKYNADGRCLLAIACRNAIIVLCMFKRPEFATHKLIMDSLLRIAELYMDDARIDAAERKRSCLSNYKHAVDFSQFSVFYKQLVIPPNLAAKLEKFTDSKTSYKVTVALAT